MTHWRELFGFKPRLEDFAKTLIARARSNDGSPWVFDREGPTLKHPKGATLHLTNVFLEYCQADRALRPQLLRKCEGMMGQCLLEIPKLWGLAATNIFPVVRSVYDDVMLEIAARNDESKVLRRARWPFVGDLHLRLVYDHGDSLAQVSEEFLDTWGQAPDAVLARALDNLRALERPQWRKLDEYVFQLDSNVSYEESFLLVDAVVDALPFASSAVLMPANRGVLLTCNGSDVRALERLFERAEASLGENPWPLSATLLQRQAGRWVEFELPESARELYGAIQRVSLAITYNDQRDALQEHVGEAFYVGDYSLIRKSGPKDLKSWSSWTEGVPTYLPKTDFVVLGKTTGGDNHDLTMVSWPQLLETAGHRLQPTKEFPARFLVEGFVSDEEWTKLKRTGESVGGS